MPELKRPRILIGDDREENRYILRRILSEAGYDCIEAPTGSKALELAETLPDLIVLDVRLPDISGYNVCRRIKGNRRTAGVPILQISASFISTEDRVRALDAGADGYLTHPIDRMVLVATVRALLRLHIAESAAQNAAEEWGAAFNALNEGLAILDAENRLVRWNAAFVEICGDRFNPQTGSDPVAFFSRIAAQDLTAVCQERATAEFAIDDRTVQLSIGPIESNSGNHEKMFVVSDITDRKVAEYAVRTAEKLAATGKLANAIAHEINNPLEAVTNLLYLARQSEDLDSIKDLLARASSELDRIGRITRQTLAFHRDTQRPVFIDIGDLVADVVALYQGPCSARRVRVIFDKGPAPRICGFPGQLTQVFGNLIRNASEAAPSGSEVVVRVRSAERGSGTRVTIHDRGPGIPRRVREKIFDPFFTTKELKGSGLGLWVSRRIIAKHNGAIRFRSCERPGQSGTTFCIFLPANQQLKAERAPSPS